MTIRYQKGDIIQLAKTGDYDILVHGCNCFNTMKSGVAKLIADEWPQVIEADNRWDPGDREKLGSFTESHATIKSVGDLVIINAYTQYEYGRDKNRCYFDYTAFANVLEELKVYDVLAPFVGYAKFLAPKIGSGLANGDWNIISRMIDQSPLDFTIAEL